MALPATLRSPARATLLVLVLLAITAVIAGLARHYLLNDLSDTLALMVTGLLVVTVGGLLLVRFVAWPLASRRAELWSETVESQSAIDHDQRFRKLFSTIDDQLSNATSETQVITILGEGLASVELADLVELHVIDPLDDTLQLAAASRKIVLPVTVNSPWDAMAASLGQTVVTATTSDPESCRHLSSRVAAAVSAVSVPLTAQGGILGVLHATGPNNDPPTDTAVIVLEAFAARAAMHIALQRSSAEAWREHVDPTTSLPAVADVERLIARNLGDRRGQSVAWVSIDGFTELDATGGVNEARVVSDYAHRWLASLLLGLLPPHTVIGTRSDGEFLLTVSAQQTPLETFVQNLEDVRATVADRQNPHLPALTMSAGVVPARPNETVVELLAHARSGFDHARRAGGNKVIKPVNPVNPVNPV